MNNMNFSNAFVMLNSGATLARCIKWVLKGLTRADNCMDDILVHTATWEEHLIALRKFFEKLTAAGLTLQPKLCCVGHIGSTRLWQEIHQGIWAPLFWLIGESQIGNTTRDEKELRSLLGLTSFTGSLSPIMQQLPDHWPICKEQANTTGFSGKMQRKVLSAVSSNLVD